MPSLFRLASPSGLRIDFGRDGSLLRFDADGGNVTLNLFIGSAADGGFANLWLRRRRPEGVDVTPLLGPRSPTVFAADPARRTLRGSGESMGLRLRLAFELAEALPAWSWRVEAQCDDGDADLDVVHAQDIALAPYGAVRTNEFYVSQYVDHQPLAHRERGWVVASRQNLAVSGRYPWCAIGAATGRAVAFATDALQLLGRSARSNSMPGALLRDLPAERLQHEHSMVALQHKPLRVAAGRRATFGFVGVFVADHPAATSEADLDRLDAVVAWQRMLPPLADTAPGAQRSSSSLFARAPLDALDLDDAALRARFGGERRHDERDGDGTLLSFFHGDGAHVALRAKELAVLRPHGQLLRTGRHAVPDETALTSTVWMGGVFHSMVTQGHVAINRFLSTVHGYLGFDRSHGLRVFVELGGEWCRLDVPSAFEMTACACRWLYHHAGGLIEVTSDARSDPHSLGLAIDVREGAPLRCLVTLHVALGGDDGSAPGAALVERDGDAIVVRAPDDSDVGRRFPRGSFRVVPASGTRIERVGGDELLHTDGRTRDEPFVCIVTAPAKRCGFALEGRLVDSSANLPTGAPSLAATLRFVEPAGDIAQLADMLPWLKQNALVHYLSPRGLEQYSGGGWGTRDVCQGPVELLLAHGDTAPVRDLLARVMRAQASDGDWPQWFMFFERERAIRAPDSHGDIVFWPLLALAEYLLASGDAAFLDEALPFFDGAPASVWQHAGRALALIRRRVIAGTALAAYGHGDWNDALQPADPVLRERMCSAWTVTLHHQTLATLARALRSIGRDADAEPLERGADAVRADFCRLLMPDGVLAGYALFDDDGGVRHLLHPRDATTGVRYSALAMIHAIDADLFTPDEARRHLALIDEHLRGPDGVRLFDRPLAYHGGIQRLFQRAESASFFGREIGLMYMHAHLRYAQALAHVGDAQGFLDALSLAHPIALRDRLPQAAPRQANCYYSSSDAAFRDRYQASAEYDRLFDGSVALEGGWRVYSSGAGIALRLVVGYLLGLRWQARAVELDPVMPPSLDGLRVAIEFGGRSLEVVYSVGGSGAGVTAVDLDGVALPFERVPNPHRPGAARIDRAGFERALRAGARRLRIAVGGVDAASG